MVMVGCDHVRRLAPTELRIYSPDHSHSHLALTVSTLYLHSIYRAYLQYIYSIYCATPGRRTRAAAHQQHWHWDQLETIIQINLNPSHHQQRHYLYQHSQLNCQHLYHLLGYLECLMMKVKPVGILNHVWKLKELSRICWWYKLNVMKYCEPSAVSDVPRPHTCYGLPVHKHCNCLDTAASRPRVQGKMLRLIILPGKCQILFTDLPLIVHISCKNSLMSHVVNTENSVSN